MRRAGTAVGAASVALALAACGGGGARKVAVSVVERGYGTGAGQVWVFKPVGRAPRALVVFFHGLGDQKETTPYYHRPWLRHLAARGNVVLYPRFEKYPGAPGALRHAIDGIRTAMEKTTLPGAVPVVVIGYSRGGGLAVDYAAVAPVVGPTPRAVLGVFPAMQDPQFNLRGIQAGTRFVFLVGDEDSVAGDQGARLLKQYLEAFDYPSKLISTELVRSGNGFVATHLSVLETTPGARKAFWERADRLIDEVIRARRSA
jgi:acetyl esterase/lipase